MSNLHNNAVNIALDILKNNIERSSSVDFRTKKTDNTKINNNLIKNVNNAVLINVLSPEIKTNEKSKRIHKYILLFLLALFLISQFWAVHTITLRVLDFAFTNNDSIEITKTLLTFVTGYRFCHY